MKTKTVTRRSIMSWRNLKEGQCLIAVHKVMGLKKGEKREVLAHIKVLSVNVEKMNSITKSDVVKEGFPEWEPSQFIDFCHEKLGIKPEQVVRRIEFEYL